MYVSIQAIHVNYGWALAPNLINLIPNRAGPVMAVYVKMADSQPNSNTFRCEELPYHFDIPHQQLPPSTLYMTRRMTHYK